MNFIKWLMQRPSDKTIQIIRVVFGLTLCLAAYYNLIYQADALESVFFGQEVSIQVQNAIKYGLVGLGAIIAVVGISDFKLLKSKYVRYSQIFLALLLFYMSSKIVETPELDFDTGLFLMSFLPLFNGVTGKLITKSGLKHGQKITKVRV